MYRTAARYLVLALLAIGILWDVFVFAIDHPEATFCAACWDINMFTYWLFGLCFVAIFVHALIVPYFRKWLFPEPLERQTCPRRGEGPQYDRHYQDCWVRNRWDHKKRYHAWTTVGMKQVPIGEKRQTWFLDWIPRSCDYCGSIHPDDAIRLVELGWEVEQTDKGYKWYLHPPGFRFFVLQCYRKLTEGYRKLTEGEKQALAKSWEPVPPVKLYAQHLSEEQAARITALLKARGT